MLLISPDKDSFDEMSSVKEKVVEELSEGGMLASLEKYAAAGSRGGFSVGKCLEMYRRCNALVSSEVLFPE